MVQHSEVKESPVPTATFPPLTRTGIIGGLTPGQLGLVVLAAIVPIWQFTVGENPPGALMSVLWWTTPWMILAVGSWRGRSFLSRLTTQGLFVVRAVGGQTGAVPSLRGPFDPTKLHIAGAAGERARLFDLKDVTFGAGAAFVWDSDPSAQTASAVIAVETEGWIMADEQAKADRAHGVSELCRQLSQMNDIVRVAALNRAYVAGHDQLPAPELIDANTELGQFTRLEYADMLSTTAMQQMMRRDTLIVVTVSKKGCAAEIDAHGGEVEGLSAVLSNRVERVLEMLPDCGVNLTNARWLGAGGIRAAVRLAVDPEAAAFLEDNGWEHPADTPLVTFWREMYDHLITNSGYHRSWWVERWPASEARAGILHALVGGGGWARTVTEIWEPVDLHTSERKFINHEASKETAERMNKLLGRPQSVASIAEDKDMVLRHQEMQRGYGDVRYSGFVTIHARSKEELDQSDMWVRQATPGMNMNKCRGRQGATFITAAMPLGFRDGGL